MRRLTFEADLIEGTKSLVERVHDALRSAAPYAALAYLAVMAVIMALIVVWLALHGVMTLLQ